MGKWARVEGEGWRSGYRNRFCCLKEIERGERVLVRVRAGGPMTVPGRRRPLCAGPTQGIDGQRRIEAETITYPEQRRCVQWAALQAQHLA